MKYIFSMMCLFLLIVGAGMVSATQRSSRRQTDVFLTNLEKTLKRGNVVALEPNNTILTERQKKQIAMHLALERGDIVQAIEVSPQETATDRYNLGTLKVLGAYQAMVANEKDAYIQWITEANHDFTEARKQSTNNAIKNHIHHNQTILMDLQKIATMKTCLNNLTTLLGTIDSIQETSKDIKTTIEQQKTINNTTSIDKECRNTLQTDDTRMYDSINDMEQTLAENKEAYTKINDTYNNNPVLCFDTDFTEQLQSITDIQKTFQETEQTYIQRGTAETNNDTTTLRALCKKNQEDNFSNQPTTSIQSSIKNMSDMAKQIQENQSQTTEKKGGKKIENPTGSSDTPIYIPITQEESITSEIDKTSNQWIQTMMYIKNTGYDPTQILKDLFQKFYGDEQEFNIPNW